LLQEAAELVSRQPNHELPPEPMKFSEEKFLVYTNSLGIQWPSLPSGRPCLHDDDVLKPYAELYPETIGPIRELRKTLSKLHGSRLAIGPNGRNRHEMWPFSSSTARNQPKASDDLFLQAKWMRGLIRPGPGRAVIYGDWEGQEYGAAAKLSNDPVMIEDYLSGDPHLAFAKRMRAVPANATKETHPKERDIYKVCGSLGAMYGAGEKTIAQRLGISVQSAKELLQAHRHIYRQFWRSDAVETQARFRGGLQTVFGWRRRLARKDNLRSVRNFAVQANAAEMLRIAVCLMVERGLQVCTTVHDAVVVEGPADGIELVAEQVESIMREASRIIPPGRGVRVNLRPERDTT
jgi:hypothetical protein